MANLSELGYYFGKRVGSLSWLTGATRLTWLAAEVYSYGARPWLMGGSLLTKSSLGKLYGEGIYLVSLWGRLGQWERLFALVNSVPCAMAAVMARTSKVSRSYSDAMP